jgi:hypothetical protein
MRKLILHAKIHQNLPSRFEGVSMQSGFAGRWTLVVGLAAGKPYDDRQLCAFIDDPRPLPGINADHRRL